MLQTFENTLSLEASSYMLHMITYIIVEFYHVHYLLLGASIKCLSHMLSQHVNQWFSTLAILKYVGSNYLNIPANMDGWQVLGIEAHTF